MPTDARSSAIRDIARRPSPAPSPHLKVAVTEIFGTRVFNEDIQRERLPENVFAKLQLTTRKGKELDSDIADAVASAMKDWAVEKGATHYTHWFQPMTGLTAEKHDSFLAITADDRIINEFSGGDLIRGEPDASSFPSGGLRSTFEARGYTAWDPTSPAFLRDGPGGMTLCIPTVFCSWSGEALDKKTPLLRSENAIDRAAVRLLNLMGHEDVTQVFSTIGCEQEYFLVDRTLAVRRPDLLTTGRTLFGAAPPKGQELDDNYFGAISPRVLGFMQELEYELWRLGIPVKTRHNEVAPMQFELAPIHRRAAVSTDQNMLIMEMMRVVAERHGFFCLLHEKPFTGINGSGKHTNWSLQDNTGHNLLAPGKTPESNQQFIVFLSAIIRAVDRHADLLRLTVASAGNDHRLGANEAPPAIMSVFLGQQLEDIVDALVTGSPNAGRAATEPIRLGISTLPPLPRDTGDRNRTSPFAFTGAKFEFRAVGSSQSVAYPSTVLNTIVAESLDDIADMIEEGLKSSKLNTVIQETVKTVLSDHRKVLFSGDNYSQEWALEAERRGLPNLQDTPSALAHFTDDKNIALFERMKVLSEREIRSRARVLLENYAAAIRIEALTSLDLGRSMLLPAALAFQQQVACTIRTTEAAVPGIDQASQKELLEKVTTLAGHLRHGLDDLAERIERFDAIDASPMDKAILVRDEIIPAMRFVRAQSDALEAWVDDDLWPLPKYRELLLLQ